MACQRFHPDEMLLPLDEPRASRVFLVHPGGIHDGIRESQQENL